MSKKTFSGQKSVSARASYSGDRTSDVYLRVPLRAIYRAITEIILDDYKMDKWTKSRAIYHKNHKNRKYRGFTRVTM